MIAFPNAKINIGLNVTNRRSDGYHDIETVMYPVAIHDVVEVIPANKYSSFTISGRVIPGANEDNLCMKAYELLRRDCQLPAVTVHLHKVIPFGAGLGGGSADAASCIKLLNSIFDLNLTVLQMEDYARQLGSDCAFFIENKPVFAFGRGDRLMPLDISFDQYYITIIKPDIHVSTKEAYAGIIPRKPYNSLEMLVKAPITEWKNTIVNDFELPIFERYPQIKVIKETLYQLGAVYASMTGSGSAVYGIFNDKTDVRAAFEGCEVYSGS